MTTSASATDRTVNKIALCSAIFAGAAYVGYSVARQAFGRSFQPPHRMGSLGSRRQGKHSNFPNYYFRFKTREKCGQRKIFPQDKERIRRLLRLG